MDSHVLDPWGYGDPRGKMVLLVGMVWGVWVGVKCGSGNLSGAGHPGGWGGRGCKS